MPEPQANSSTSQTYRPGRSLGVVRQDHGRDKGFVFLEGTDGAEYFAHISAFEKAHWDELVVGDAVSFSVTETTKGLRAYKIQPATEAERVEIDAQEENRGNR